MNKVFVDSEVILDLLCKREPHYRFAAQVFTAADQKRVRLFTSAVAFANVFYMLRKQLGIERAKECLRKLRLLIDLIPVDNKVVDLALNSRFADFEDGLQCYSARENGIAILLTRNVRDYKEPGIIVQTPEEYIKAQAQG